MGAQPEPSAVSVFVDERGLLVQSQDSMPPIDP